MTPTTPLSCAIPTAIAPQSERQLPQSAHEVISDWVSAVAVDVPKNENRARRIWERDPEQNVDGVHARTSSLFTPDAPDAFVRPAALTRLVIDLWQRQTDRLHNVRVWALNRLQRRAENSSTMGR